MTDKFPMHSDFPMDEAYKAKAAERGFDPGKALWLFERWREYWIGRTDTERTPRGWAQCWDNDLKSKARNGARNTKGGRFERRDDNRMPTQPSIIWVGGRGYGPAEIIGLRRKRSLLRPLEWEEREALKIADGQ